MPDPNTLTDWTEMIAAIAALLVTFILYLESRKMRDEMKDIRKEMLTYRDQLTILLNKDK